MPETSSTTYREFTITRVFDASRELVFKAWTDPAHVALWFGPLGYRTPVSGISLDVRPGGSWRATMISDSDGSEHPVGGVYLEVVEPERLVFTGGRPADPDVEGKLVATVLLVDLGGPTEMAFHQAGVTERLERAGIEENWASGFDCLAEYVCAVTR
jgi:uncharacterized protein YndB with AHSA1/START domain